MKVQQLERFAYGCRVECERPPENRYIGTQSALAQSKLTIGLLATLMLMLGVSGCTGGNVFHDVPGKGVYLADVADEFQPLFNGKDLTGWEGNKELWFAENGEIVGKSGGIKKNEFLATTTRYSNFILKYKFKMINTSGNANSGMQFRSERVANSTECYGYQADVGQDYWGCLYDESRRKKVLVKPAKELMEKAVKRDDWNEYVITCDGDHITLELNGVKTVDYTETEPSDKVARDGILALQIHAGGPMEIHAKDILIKVLK